ncbi:MAG: glycosyltransferase [Pseudomonadaceae bacterium]|nr:glycosyltransferase [Pseudomonadaceae bacterium]
MNILHAIFTKEFAGSERYACQLAAMQAAAGHKVLLLIKPPRGDEGLAYVHRMVREAGAAQVAHIPAWWPSVLDSWAVRGVANGFAPEMIHTHLGRATKRCAKAAKALKVPHVATLHLAYGKDYAACDGLVCIAEWQRAGIPASYKGKVATVWNWVHPVKRKAVGKAGVVTFGSVGRLVDKKGMDVLVAAFREAFPKGTEKVALEIVGQGPQRAELEKLAMGDGRISLLGFVENVEALYPRWHTYVSAARYEPFGLTILEAMAAGCRLVCSTTQGPQEFLADYKVGWAEAGHVGSMAKALRAAAKQPPVRVPWDMSPFAPKRALAAIEGFYKSF